MNNDGNSTPHGNNVQQRTEDEDAHLCLRCHSTIIGLQNYVVHRQNPCHQMSMTKKKDYEKFSYEKKNFQEKLSPDSSHDLMNQPSKSEDFKYNSNKIIDNFSNLKRRLQEPNHLPNLDKEVIDIPITVENNSRIIHDVKELQGDSQLKKSSMPNKATDLHRLSQNVIPQNFPQVEMQRDLSQTQLRSQNFNSSFSKYYMSSSEGDVDHSQLNSSSICLQVNSKSPSMLCSTSLLPNQNRDSPPHSTPNTLNMTLEQHLIHHTHEASPSIANDPRSIDDLRPTRNLQENLKSKTETKNSGSSESLFRSYENKVKQNLEYSSGKGPTAQTPFTSFTDPLLLHTQDNTNIFRQFEGFVEQGKNRHVGSSIAPIFSKASTSNYEMENPKNAYDLESANFESRYQEFYSIQSSSQESLLSPNHLIDISNKRNPSNSQEVKTSLQVIGCMPDPCVKRREEVEVMEYQSSGSFSESEAQVSAEYQATATTDTVKDEVLGQDDFLSSLELCSRPKIVTKQPNNEEEEEEDDDEDEMRPPSHHTGGKWRPGLHSSASTGVGWRSCTQRSEVEDEELEEDHDEEEVDRVLSPSYTKGKWLPGKRITNKGSPNIEHFCQSCNRKLRDQNTYDRHLLSQLHFINEGKAKAKLEEKNGNEDLNSSLRSRPVRLKRIAAQRFLKKTIAQLKSKKMFVQNEITDLNENTNFDDKMETPNVKSQNPISKESMKIDVKQESSDEELEPTICAGPKLMCPICRLSFGASYVSLHFASLAHIHNELEHRHNPTQSSKEEYNNIIVKYMDEIFKTSYFKCKPCKFYCNLHEDLYVHMKTHNDEITESELKKLFSCSSCNDENGMQIKEFLRHLQTPHHREKAREEVLLSHQVTIDTKTAVICPLCNKHFRYFHAYRRHRKMFHEEPEFQLSHQRILHCPKCNFQASDYKLIRAHIRENHEDQENSLSSYYCFVCGLGFKSLQEAEIHRRSVFHRTTVGRQKGLSVARTCNMCYEIVPDLASLRVHMVERHSSECSPCHICGHVPPLRADLAQHQRNCKGEVLKVNGTHKCQLCPFKNNLLAHVLSHTTLSHGTPDSDTRYPCHICKTKLRTTSVKGHMLSHSNEWPHGCHLCSRKFPWQDWLSRHLATVHHRGTAQTNAQTHQLCHHCGTTFTNSSHLKRHLDQNHGHALLASPKETMATKNSSNHRLKVNIEANTKILCHLCGHQADSQSYMKIHMRGHRCKNGGQLECPHCNYVTGHLPHLRRHLRLHTGSTPFVCPYCPYECNNQENLRKHMLKTKLHPGRYMYECRLCIDSPDLKKSRDCTDSSNLKITNELELYVYKSNYSKELHSHLLQHHHQHFNNKEQVSAHIRSYYHPESDITVTDNPKPYLHKKRKRSWVSVKKDSMAQWSGEDVALENVSDDDVISHSKIEEQELQPNQHKEQPKDNQQTILQENLQHHIPKISVSNQLMKIRILDSNGTPQTYGDQSDHSDLLLNQVKQILKEEQLSKGDQNSYRQVIMIVPDDIVNSVGELASLLPTLGLPTSTDNISVLTLHNDENHKPQQYIQDRAEVIQEQNLSLIQLEAEPSRDEQLTESQCTEHGVPSKTGFPNNLELTNLTQEQTSNQCYEISDMSQNDNTKIKEQNSNIFLTNEGSKDFHTKEMIASAKNRLDFRDKETNVIYETIVPSEKSTTYVGGNNIVSDERNVYKNKSISPLISNKPQLIQGEMFVLERDNANSPQNLSVKSSNDTKIQENLDNLDINNSNFSQNLNDSECEHEMQSIVLVEDTVFDKEDILIIHENLEFPSENIEIMQKDKHLLREVSVQPNNGYQDYNLIPPSEDNVSKLSNPSYVKNHEMVEYNESFSEAGQDNSHMISVDEVSQAVEVVTSETSDGSPQVIYTFTL